MNPPNKERSPSPPNAWMEHARSDMRFAVLGMEETGVLPHHICFHAQQVAEKVFKAVLLSYKVDFPPTHDIQQLLRLLEKAGVTIPYDVQNAGILTPYAVETRYPGYWGEIGETDVREAVLMAETILKWAETMISGSK